MFQDQGSGNFGFAETKLLRDIHFCYRKRSGGGGGGQCGSGPRGTVTLSNVLCNLPHSLPSWNLNNNTPFIVSVPAQFAHFDARLMQNNEFHEEIKETKML